MLRFLFIGAAVILVLQPSIEARLKHKIPRCPQICRKYCPYGYVRKNGCRLCRCKAPVVKRGKCPIIRLTICKWYRHTCFSDSGCKGNQKCCWYGCGRRCVKPVPRCPPLCRMYCQYGFVHKNGCPICKCKCPPLCRMYCKYGFVHKNGCPICKCKCPPLCRMYCKYGFVHKNGCPICKCKCPPLCRMHCQYGFVHKNGCPICKCKENPCNLIDCLPDHKCIVVKRRAKCVPVSPVGACPKPTVGICVSLCTPGTMCTGGKRCCFNGCGHQCMNPIRG